MSSELESSIYIFVFSVLMKPKRILIIIFLTPCLLFALLVCSYFAKPEYFYFRAWEFFDNLIISGPYANTQFLEESGDSSRAYLSQAYTYKNNISINHYGNRVACLEPGQLDHRSILMLGDSQLFGSGLDDNDTLPIRLCEEFQIPIYNGSRLHELNLTSSKEFNFSSVIFTASERLGIKRFCMAAPDFDKASSADTTPPYSLKKSFTLNFLIQNLNYLIGYLQSRFSVVTQLTLPWKAPVADIISFQHTKSDQDYQDELKCALRLNQHYSKKGISTAFVYFPSQQTILRETLLVKSDVTTDEFIPRMVDIMNVSGLSSLDTKRCLLAAAKEGRVTQPHDTHLNGSGMRAMSQCIKESKIAKLFGR